MISLVLRRNFVVETAHSGQAALELLARHEPDAVLADHMMPGMTGVELLDEVHRLRPTAARVLVTASDRVTVLREAVNRARVHRFLSKPLRVAELSGVVEQVIREVDLEAENARLASELLEKNAALASANERLEREVEARTLELRQAVEELERMASRDGLTGLYNHRHFQDVLSGELKRADRHGHTVGLIFIDVDHFKHYNDRNGHPAGDRLLRMLAELLGGGRESRFPTAGRESDVTARYGGEEFVIMLPETQCSGAAAKAERLRACIATFPFEHAGAQPGGAVTVSVGVACYPEHAASQAELVDTADKQLYRAKRGGRNRICVAGSD